MAINNQLSDHTEFRPVVQRSMLRNQKQWASRNSDAEHILDANHSAKSFA